MDDALASINRVTWEDLQRIDTTLETDPKHPQWWSSRDESKTYPTLGELLVALGEQRR